MRSLLFVALPVLLTSVGAWACNSGTVRDAAFSGARDKHRLCVFAPEGDAEMSAAANRIDAWLAQHGESLNLRLERVNTALAEPVWADYGLTGPPRKLPVSVLVGTSSLFRRYFAIDSWDSAPSDAELDNLLASPALAEAKKHLVEQWAVVLYAPGANAPEGFERWVADWSNAHAPGVTLVRVDRADPKEHLLCVLGDLPAGGPSWAALLFGRGKLMAPMMRGEELNPENLNRLLDSLTAKCTCMEESTVLGLDLPMVWEKSLEERFAQLEAAAKALPGYSEITFEKQVEQMAESVPAPRSSIVLVLAPLLAVAALSVLYVAWLFWRNARTHGPDPGDAP